ncbi:ejaculatory bulb-specific protein 3-like [Aethina tumida]|uniref:ejaculatory bulb-specific protein 3-like n=1 Tax=Aethina tumida TaxID=116153 RepID=UPI0021474073|nr:ejaculatory bulb-specific protein 3-like [Aethina tumida]
MKVVLVFVFVCFLGLSHSFPQEKYTNKYDNINLSSILSNDRLVNQYINCVLGKGKCTAEGTELKKYLPDAIRTNCEKCSTLQQSAAKRVLLHLAHNKRPQFDELIKKYDPEGVYRSKYRAQYESEGIVF